jgi:HTH-type transcriptional regulator/antitoxin HigA
MSYKLKIAFHPGELLQDELSARGISQKDFANILGISSTKLNFIIKGKRDMDIKLAARIGEALGTGAELWINLQSKYNLWKLRQNKIEVNYLATVAQKMLTYSSSELAIA